MHRVKNSSWLVRRPGALMSAAAGSPCFHLNSCDVPEALVCEAETVSADWTSLLRPASGPVPDH